MSRLERVRTLALPEKDILEMKAEIENIENELEIAHENICNLLDENEKLQRIIAEKDAEIEKLLGHLRRGIQRRWAVKMDLLNEIMELVDNSLENIVEPHAIEYAQSFKDQLLDIRDRLNGGDDAD